MNAQLIRATLILKGMKQQELAEKIGIAPATLSNKLNSKTEFTRDEIEAIAKTLEMDVKELFFCNDK